MNKDNRLTGTKDLNDPGDEPIGDRMTEKTLDDAELTRLFEMYFDKLIRCVEKRISHSLKGKVEADDIVDTVWRTIIRRVREGTFQFEDDAEFWILLVTIAKRKVSNKVRHFSTKSRDRKREISEAANSIITTPDPLPDESVALDESMNLVLSKLTKQEQQIFAMRLEGYTFQQIADELGVSERTPRRKMDIIKKTLVEIFFDPEEAPQ